MAPLQDSGMFLGPFRTSRRAFPIMFLKSFGSLKFWISGVGTGVRHSDFFNLHGSGIFEADYAQKLDFIRIMRIVVVPEKLEAF